MRASSVPATIPPHERAANEFWVYAINNKALLLSVVIVSNLLALILFSLADSVYENRIGVVVGKTFIDGKIRPVELGMSVVHRLQAEYEIKGRNDADLKIYKPVRIIDRGSDWIFFIVQGNDREVMRKFVREPLEKLLEEHELIFEIGQKALRAAFRKMPMRLDADNLQLKNLDQVMRAPPGGGSTLQSNPEKYVEQVLAHKAMLESLLRNLRRYILKPKPTRLVGHLAPSVQVGPNLMLYLFLASVVGIILGLFGAVVKGRRDEPMV